MRSALPREEAGLTLIEVMVTMLLAAILCGGLFFLTSEQSRIYRSQLTQMDADQNLIGALEYLQSEIMLAGYPITGCGGVLRVYDSTSTTPAAGVREEMAIQVTNAADAQGSDSFSVFYAGPETAVEPTGVSTVVPHNPDDTTLTVSAAGSIATNHLLVLWAPGRTIGCTLIQATSDPSGAGTTFTFDHAASTGYNAPLSHAVYPATGYPAGSLVIDLGTGLQAGMTAPALRRRTFFIDRTGNRPPRLVAQWSGSTSRDIIADNIEDMQIAVGCDFTGSVGVPDGVISEGATPADRVSDEWFANVSATWPTPAAGSNDTQPSCRYPSGCVYPACLVAPVGAVRVTLISRSPGALVGNWSGFRPGAEDHPPGTPADDLTATGQVGTYGRSVRTIVVQPRNVRLQGS